MIYKLGTDEKFIYSVWHPGLPPTINWTVHNFDFKKFQPHPEEQYIYNLYQIPWLTNLIPRNKFLSSWNFYINSDGQYIRWCPRMPIFHCLLTSLHHRSLRLLRHLKPTYTCLPHFLFIRLNIILPSKPRSLKWCLPIKCSDYNFIKHCSLNASSINKMPFLMLHQAVLLLFANIYDFQHLLHAWNTKAGLS